MQKQKIVAILGGDGRQAAVAAYFCERGYCVRVFGLPKDILPERARCCKEWYEAVASADAVILPLPALPDGKHVGMGMGAAERAPLFSDVLRKTAKETLLAGGRFPPAAKAEAERKSADLEQQLAAGRQARASAETERERRAAVLEDVLAANKPASELARRRKKLKQIIKDTGSFVDVRTIAALEKLGFKCVSGTKHWKLDYANVRIPISKTPSDRRGAQNTATDIANRCF